ncbi:MAG: cytochrome C [Betaproteobacteria bacterium]|nr:MAG: cytochrome C [Betaproteobacteria bacterium]
MKSQYLLAAYAALGSSFALAQTVPAPATVDKNLGRNLAAQCANCHGSNGKSVAEVASLAGVPANVTIQKMKDYRDGKLPATIMHQLAKGYTDEQVALIAQYLEKQPK